MSDKEPFSNREIQLMFKNIELLLVDLKKDTSGFNHRIAKLEEKVVELERFQTKALVLWSVAVVLIGWIVNNFAKFIGV